MPKRTKKRPQASDDFQKKKRKVGKSAQKKQSFTNTDISSRSIFIISCLFLELHVSRQFDDASLSALQSYRKQSVLDLLQQSNHYSLKIRSNALLSLRQIASSAASNLIVNFSCRVWPVVIPLILDGENVVRSSLLQLVSTLLQLASFNLNAFLPLSIQYTLSALSHSQRSIQRDGVAFLDLIYLYYASDVDAHSEVLVQSLLPLFSDNVLTHSKQTRKQVNKAPIIFNIFHKLLLAHTQGKSARNVYFTSPYVFLTSPTNISISISRSNLLKAVFALWQEHITLSPIFPHTIHSILSMLSLLIADEVFQLRRQVFVHFPLRASTSMSYSAASHANTLILRLMLPCLDCDEVAQLFLDYICISLKPPHIPALDIIADANASILCTERLVSTFDSFINDNPPISPYLFVAMKALLKYTHSMQNWLDFLVSLVNKCPVEYISSLFQIIQWILCKSQVSTSRLGPALINFLTENSKQTEEIKLTVCDLIAFVDIDDSFISFLSGIQASPIIKHTIIDIILKSDSVTLASKISFLLTCLNSDHSAHALKTLLVEATLHSHSWELLKDHLLSSQPTSALLDFIIWALKHSPTITSEVVKEVEALVLHEDTEFDKIQKILQFM